MAVAFKSVLGEVGSTTSGTTLVLTTTAAIAVGDFVIVRASADNLSATTPTFTCTDSGGNTYITHIQRAVQATAAAGVAGAIMATVATNAVASGGTITVTLSGAVTSKSMFARSFTGVLNTLRNAAVSASGTSTAAAVTSGSASIGDLVCGAVGAETRATPTGDSDTTGGAWQAMEFTPSATSGSDAARTIVTGQYKIATAAGTQTYNNTTANTDWVALIAIFQPYVPPSITQAAYQFFDDAGTESGAASLAAVNTPVTGDITNGDGIGALRIRLQNTTAIAGVASDDYQLQWKRGGDEYDITNFAGAGQNLTATNTQWTQSFTARAGPLWDAAFYMIKTGTPTGTVTAALWAHDGGTFGTSGLPTGAPLATSTTTLTASTVTGTTSAPQAVVFNFDGTFRLVEGTNYFIGLIATGASASGNTVGPAIDNVASAHPGNAAFFNTIWNVNAADLIFEVNTWTNAASISYDETNRDTGDMLGQSTFASAMGQSFTGDGNPLLKARFWLNRSGAGLTSNLTALIYAHTGTFGSTGLPTGAVLATSTSKAASSLVTGTGQWEDFDFDGTFTLANGTPYFLVLAISAQHATVSVSVGVDASSPAAPGNYARFVSSWSALTVQDMIYQVQTRTTVVPYDNPNLTGGAVTTNRLGAGTGSFQAGEVCEDGVVNDLALTASNYTEIMYSLKIIAAECVHGDTLRFRVLRNGSTTGFTYTQTPTINIIRSAVNVAATITTDWGGAFTESSGDILVDSLSDANYEVDTYVSDDGSRIGIAQTITGTGEKLKQVGWYCRNQSSGGVGSVTCRLYAHTGTFGTSGVPTGSALATSNSIAIASISGTIHWHYWDFDETFTLVNGTKYVISAEKPAALGASLSVGATIAGTPHNGNSCVQNGSAVWSATSTDLIFQVLAPGLNRWKATGTVEAPVGGTNWPATITSDWGGWDAQAAATVATPVISINGLRFFNDDGALTASTALAADNASLSLLDADKPMQLRVQLVNQTSISINWNITLQCSINGGTFNSFSSGIGISAAGGSPNFATLDPVTTSRIGGGIGAFSNGSSNEAGTSVTIAIPANSYTEYVWFGLMEAADLAVSDVITFRLLKSPGSIVLPTLVTLPSITVIPPGPVDHPGTITTGWGTWTATAAGTVVAEEILATASATWGVWTATAAGTVTAEVITATITTSWGTWTATSTASIQRYGTINTNWSGGFIDTFDRADTGAPGLGSGWSAPNWGIVGNQASRDGVGSGTTADYARFLTDLGATDQWVEWVIPGIPSGDFRVVNCRMDAALGQNGVLGFLDVAAGNVCKIGKVQGGTYSDVAVGSSVTQTDPFTMRLECQGTTARLYFNGTQVATGSIAGLTLGTFAGMNANVGNAKMDRFRSGLLPYVGMGWTASATGTISTPVGWGTPQNVVATTTGQTTITVTWDAVPAATGYDVERNGTIVVMDHPASPYNDTGLSPDTPYNYRVRAVG